MSLDGFFLPDEDIRDATCAVCPAQLLRFGDFDVVDKPGYDHPYDPARGWRASRDSGAPTCVHPYRVGLPAGAYASGGVPLPPPETPTPVPDAASLVLPDDPTLLEAWLVAVLRCSSPERMASALFQAEATASERFPARDVLAAMRQVMSREMAGS